MNFNDPTGTAWTRNFTCTTTTGPNGEFVGNCSNNWTYVPEEHTSRFGSDWRAAGRGRSAPPGTDDTEACKVNGADVPSGVSIKDNIKEAASHTGDIWWFKAQVKNKAAWDYKQKGSQYQSFGNIYYGATGSALGLPDQFLLRMAGSAQKSAGTSKPDWGSPFGAPPYGDDPADQANIKAGIDIRKKGCGDGASK